MTESVHDRIKSFNFPGTESFLMAGWDGVPTLQPFALQSFRRACLYP